MNKYQEALDFIKEQLKLKHKVKEIHIAEIVDEDILIEVVCRKLHKYGLIKKEDDSWVIKDE